MPAARSGRGSLCADADAGATGAKARAAGSSSALLVCGSKHSALVGEHRNLLILRDPRDVAVSYWFYKNVSGGSDKLLPAWARKRVQRVVAQQEAQVQQALGACGALALQYESLLERPLLERARAIIGLADFIGLRELGGSALTQAEAVSALNMTSFAALKRSGVHVVAHGGARGAPKLRNGAARAFAEHMDEETLRLVKHVMDQSALMTHIHNVPMRAINRAS